MIPADKADAGGISHSRVRFCLVCIESKFCLKNGPFKGQISGPLIAELSDGPPATAMAEALSFKEAVGLIPSSLTQSFRMSRIPPHSQLVGSGTAGYSLPHFTQRPQMTFR